MRREWRDAGDPLHVLEESPDSCHNGGRQCSVAKGERLRRLAKKGSGVGIPFAMEMLRRSGVPQGLICVAHGGTALAQWMPGESLYGSMLASVVATGQPVAGVLWYQGESDAINHDDGEYTQRMLRLMRAVRRDFRQPKLPWIMVQLGRFIQEAGYESSWNSIQAQQMRIPRLISRCETVASIDLSLDDAIHISGRSFPRLANRLARAADRLAYGNREEMPPPRVKSVNYIGSRAKSSEPPFIKIRYSGTGEGLRSEGEPRGFSVVDSEGRARPLVARTSLFRNEVRLSLTGPLEDGMWLSYGYGSDPVCNITDSRDFSLPVFGPVAVTARGAYFPFVAEWAVTDVIVRRKELNEIECPRRGDYPTAIRSYGPSGFVDEHARWQGRSGQSYFFTDVVVPERMEVTLLMGYDAPFRIWLGRNSLFADMGGTNPAIKDSRSVPVSLSAGRHSITVGMDLNRGLAWGFFLRFLRRDVSPECVEKRTFQKVRFSVV